MDVVSDIFSTTATDSTCMSSKVLMLQNLSLLNVTLTSSHLLSLAGSAVALRSKTPHLRRLQRIHILLPPHRPRLYVGAPEYLREHPCNHRPCWKSLRHLRSRVHPHRQRLHRTDLVVCSDLTSVPSERTTIMTFFPPSQKQRDNDSRCYKPEQNKPQIRQSVLQGRTWERTSARRSRCKIVFFVVHTRTRLYE